MGSKYTSVLLEGEASGYSNVREVGCRKPTSRPWKRLPRATCVEEGGGPCWVLTCQKGQLPLPPTRSSVPTYTGGSAQA